MGEWIPERDDGGQVTALRWDRNVPATADRGFRLAEGILNRERKHVAKFGSYIQMDRDAWETLCADARWLLTCWTNGEEIETERPSSVDDRHPDCGCGPSDGCSVCAGGL